MQTLPGAAETLRRDAVSRTSSGRPAGPMTADPADGAARVALAGLFLALSYRIGLDVVETGRLTGLLLLTSELLVVVLTLVRRTASQVDRRWQVRLIALASIAGPMMVRPSAAGGLLGGPYTLAISFDRPGDRRRRQAVTRPQLRSAAGESGHRLCWDLPVCAPSDLSRLCHHARRVPRRPPDRVEPACAHGG